MSGIIARLPGRPTPHDLFGWWAESGLPGAHPVPGLHGIRVEERLAYGTYVLRAELPGIDPTKDVEITVSEGVLTLRAERTVETTEEHRTEFRYGSFARSARLSAEAKGEEATAEYTDGDLTITVRSRGRRRVPGPSRCGAAETGARRVAQVCVAGGFPGHAHVCTHVGRPSDGPRSVREWTSGRCPQVRWLRSARSPGAPVHMHPLRDRRLLKGRVLPRLRHRMYDRLLRHPCSGDGAPGLDPWVVGATVGPDRPGECVAVRPPRRRACRPPTPETPSSPGPTAWAERPRQGPIRLSCSPPASGTVR